MCSRTAIIVGLIAGAFAVALAPRTFAQTAASSSNPTTLATSRAAAPIELAPAVVDPSMDRLDKSLSAAIKYLRGQIGADGRCISEFPRNNLRFGGRTSLCVYALLTAGQDHKDPVIRRAIDWLGRQTLTGTYAVAMRTCALAAFYDATRYEGEKDTQERCANLLRQDVKWLMDAPAKSGAYTYTSCGGKPSDMYDNSNSQVALGAIATGADALNIEIPRAFWQMTEQHWRDQQQIDGGWGYLIPPGALKCRSYGSMTAAGLASLYICYDNLHRDQFARCGGSEVYKPIDAGLKWIEEHFAADENPGKGVEWYFYWLYSLQRVGIASGQKYIGGHDWYADGVANVLSMQDSRGYWGTSDPVSETAFALMFVTRGRQAVLLNKLDFRGKWNTRPRDAANFVAWVSRTYERQVGWQAVNLEASLGDLHDAPILYISGAGPLEVSDQQVDRLRQYVLQGGTIISESACNNADFTLDIQKLNKRMFPHLTSARLPNNHPVYHINFAPTREMNLTAVSNGVRLLTIHNPSEMSLGLQMGPTGTFMASYETMANLCLYVTDRGVFRPRGMSVWPEPQQFKPAATIRVARLKYAGNYDPEPLAWRRLAILMGNRNRIKLEVSEPIDITALDAAKWPIASLTGTGEFKFSDAQLAALRKFVSAGGTLVGDAAGGAKAFTSAFESQIVPALDDDSTYAAIVARHAIYKGPLSPRITYRRDYAMTMKDQHVGRLMGIQTGKRLSVIFSPDDMTAAMVGYPCYGIAGYSGESAVELMTSILCYASGVKLEP